jgi:oxygen-independent coproporphyrinogen III oxidase
MKSKTIVFDEAYSSLHRLGIPDMLPTLHAAGVAISRSVLGGSHSVAIYPPIDSLTPVDPIVVVNSIEFQQDVSLYIHIAFCETRCTFCHYVVNHYGGKGKSSQARDIEVAHYLDALDQELKFWGERLARSATGLSSIYIGGGTPLLLEHDALNRIIRILQDEYQILPGAEVCIEGSPLTITAPGGEEKLRFLKEQGVTRLSFGVQSFDDTVLKYAGRGYTRDVPIQAALIANQVFDNWNLDLIQGLYKGSPPEVWGNLSVIAEIRPPHLTWYHGRFGNRPQGDWYKTGSKNSSFEDEPATLLGRMLIWQEMAALGYNQIDGNRFVRNYQYIDPFKKIRTSASKDLLGVGAASYSHVGTKAMNGDSHGYMFRNQSTVRSYLECVLSGKVPIATGRLIDEEELLAASYATGLRNGRIEDDKLSSIRRKKPQLSKYYQDLEDKLREIGVLETYMDDCGKPGVRITELGKLFEDEVLALFFSPAVKSAVATKALGYSLPVAC